MGFILMYDITNEESFNAVQDWYEIHSLIHHTFMKTQCMLGPVLCARNQDEADMALVLKEFIDERRDQ